MGDVQCSCGGGKGPEGMMALGLPVAEGTAAGGFSVKGLTDELEAAELAEAEALVMVDEAEAVAEASVLLLMVMVELAELEGASLLELEPS